jgi:hypothetical protein
MPVWAMGSAGAIGALAILPEVNTLVILGEIDGGASKEAIACCVNRWCRTAGKKVTVIIPTIDKDFADVWARADSRWREHVAIEQFRS